MVAQHTDPIDDSMLTARKVSLRELVSLLEDQHTRKLDVVAAASKLRAEGGQLVVAGAGKKLLTLDGVSDTDVTLRPTASADGDISDKLGIPVKYLRRLRADGKVELYDHNVNTWLRELGNYKLFTRALVDDGDSTGIARALLSSSYRVIDNLDVLYTVLEGVRAAGVPVEISQCDLSETRMYVKVSCPDIAEYAPDLLRGYTSPFSGAKGADNPLVFAGFVISNSEVGAARTTITPQLTIEVCANGMTITKDALRETHLGARMDEGVVRWSEDTRRAEIDLISRQARDAVTTFLDRDYVRAKLTEIQQAAHVEVTQPQATIEHVAGVLRFTNAQRDTVFAHFIKGGDTTSGGVLHAVSSAAQLIADVDEAYAMEAQGLRAMTTAAGFASRAR
ncbi:MAG: DUF932 domain-containing protein [Pseudonocardia sp.]